MGLEAEVLVLLLILCGFLSSSREGWRNVVFFELLLVDGVVLEVFDFLLFGGDALDGFVLAELFEFGGSMRLGDKGTF